jgi:TonB-linked SusC/RagA family outer membrane protein
MLKMKNKYIIGGCILLIISLLNTAGLCAQEKKDSLVNVAFGTIAKKDVLGAISTVNASDLTEKKYSTYSLDGLQSFVGGYTGNIWGQSPLILVDGSPRNANDVRLTEVESISVLKDASAIVLYGSKAAKGVVLITTKRGRIQPLTIDVRANTGIFVPKRYPNYLNAADYMTLYNEASRNDGIAERYSQEQIYNTAAGTNPFRYPDINFFSSDYLRKVYNRTDLTGEIHGGTERARYYTNFGMAYNNSLMNYGYQKKNNDWRFNVRANVDMNLTEWLTASTRAAVVISDNYSGRGNFWGTSATLRPNWFAPLLPVDMLDPHNETLKSFVETSSHLIDGKYLLGGTTTDQTNAFSDMLAAGYIKNKNRTFQFDLNMGADLASLLQGLTFKTAFSLDYRNYYNEAYKVDYAVYQPYWSNTNGEDMIYRLDKINVDKSSTSEYIGEANYAQTITMSGQFNYDRTFGSSHNVTAALLGWGYQIQSSADENHGNSSYHRTSNLNLGLQAGYNYNHTYYIDLSTALIHSAQLPEGNRNAISPSATLGWRISENDFFRNNVAFVDNLKLTTSYSVLNQDLDITWTIDGDVVNYYLYKGYFDNRGGWYQWRDGAAGGWTTGSKRGDNPNLTFIQRKEFRVGLDAALFNNLLSVNANYFRQNTDGGLTQGSATLFPSFFSDWDFSFLPYLNYNKDRRTGVDFSVNLNKKIGEIQTSLGFSGMYFSSKAIRRDEVYQDEYQYRVGKPLDAYWGYISEGLFMDEADIENHARQTFGEVKPGDIKYKDVNGDGLIDSRDQVNLGHNGWAVSPFSYGLNLTLKWKNFTLFAMGTGNSGAIGFKNNSYYWIRGNSKYSDVVLDRTTIEKNSADKWVVSKVGAYPRLTTTDNSNNFQNSTFWMYKTKRFDLNRVQLTYDFSDRLPVNSIINGLNVYVSGESLLTISEERKLMETNIGSAPQNRHFNVGLKASF